MHGLVSLVDRRRWIHNRGDRRRRAHNGRPANETSYTATIDPPIGRCGQGQRANEASMDDAQSFPIGPSTSMDP